MFKKYLVKPINKISDIPKGTFDWQYSWITDETVPLKELTEEKEITILEFNETLESDQLDAWIAKQGTPIEPNYLLGLAVQYPEAFESGKGYVSASSVFKDRHGFRCFLSVDRDDGERGLYLVPLEGDWRADFGWCFLADTSKLKTDPSALESLDISVQKAIETVKEAGYKVIKEL